MPPAPPVAAPPPPPPVVVPLTSIADVSPTTVPVAAAVAADVPSAASPAPSNALGSIDVATTLAEPSPPAQEMAVDHPGEVADESLTLPVAQESRRDNAPLTATKGSAAVLPMLPFRSIGVGGTATALILSAWQAVRVLNGQERLASLSIGALLAAAVGALGVVLWTWVVTANARRTISPARTLELPEPAHAALTWVVPLVFIAGAAASITYLSRRLNSPTEGTESTLPFILALVAMILSLPMMYSPVTYLSGVVRKVGGKGIRFAEWIWVSVTLAVVGAMMIAGLRFGGAFGDDFDGLAPAWVVGVTAIVPAVVIVLLGWRAGGEVEADIMRAIDRRRGVSPKISQRRGKFTKIYAEGGPNHAALRQRGFISLLPGASIASLIVSVVLGGLALLSLVGGLIMVLFWQEARDGILLPSQTANAWDLVERLQAIDYIVVLIAVGVTTLWSFLVVTNVRLASARRRNPVLAAAAWPAAAGGIWIVSSRLVADGSVAEVVLGLAAQAVVLAVPFLLVYRAAGSIGSRRQAIRITWAIGVILLVHVQGLGGLSTATTTVESTEVARLCGYLVIGAVLHALLMFSAASAMRAVVDTTAQVANRHNSLIAQRDQAEVSRTRSTSPGPRMSDPDINGGAEA